MAERAAPTHATHHVLPDALVGLTVARFQAAIVHAYEAAVASGRPLVELALVLGDVAGTRPFVTEEEHARLAAVDPPLDVVVVATPRARVVAVLARSCPPCAERFRREAARGVPLHLAVGRNAFTVGIVSADAPTTARGGETVH